MKITDQFEEFTEISPISNKDNTKRCQHVVYGKRLDLETLRCFQVLILGHNSCQNSYEGSRS